MKIAELKKALQEKFRDKGAVASMMVQYVSANQTMTLIEKMAEPKRLRGKVVDVNKTILSTKEKDGK